MRRAVGRFRLRVEELENNNTVGYAAISRLNMRLDDMDNNSWYWKNSFIACLLILAACVILSFLHSQQGGCSDILLQNVRLHHDIAIEAVEPAVTSTKILSIAAQKVFNHARIGEGSSRKDIGWSAGDPRDVSANAGLFSIIHSELGIASFVAKKAHVSAHKVKSLISTSLSHMLVSDWEMLHYATDSVEGATFVVHYLDTVLAGELHPSWLLHNRKDWLIQAKKDAMVTLDKVSDLKKVLVLYIESRAVVKNGCPASYI